MMKIINTIAVSENTVRVDTTFEFTLRPLKKCVLYMGSVNENQTYYICHVVMVT